MLMLNCLDIPEYGYVEDILEHDDNTLIRYVDGSFSFIPTNSQAVFVSKGLESSFVTTDIMLLQRGDLVLEIF